MSARPCAGRGRAVAVAVLAAIVACTCPAAVRAESAPAPAASSAPDAATPAQHHAAHGAHGAAAGAHDATARHSFEDGEHRTRVFDDPARDAWQKPAEVVAALQDHLLLGGAFLLQMPRGADTGDPGAHDHDVDEFSHGPEAINGVSS